MSHHHHGGEDDIAVGIIKILGTVLFLNFASNLVDRMKGTGIWTPELKAKRKAVEDARKAAAIVRRRTQTGRQQFREFFYGED